MNINTDLALEAREFAGNNIDGAEVTEKSFDGMHVTRINIITEKASEIFGKDKGAYITAEFSSMPEIFSGNGSKAEIIGRYIRELLPDEGTVLVAGLGNYRITPDALGPQSTKYIIATRHIKSEISAYSGLQGLRSTAVIAPGVLGQTGIEAGELILSTVQKIKPSAVIAVDALASRRTERLGCTLQISNTGISPGAGIGNRRIEIKEKFLGIPVIAIGVPTVVNAYTLVFDILRDKKMDNTNLTEKNNMFVTPREIDTVIEKSSRFIGMAVNMALHEGYSLTELIEIAG